MSWDEYVKSCKRAVTQRQQPDQSPPLDPRALPVELLQTFRLPGPCSDSVSLLLWQIFRMFDVTQNYSSLKQTSSLSKILCQGLTATLNLHEVNGRTRMKNI